MNFPIDAVRSRFPALASRDDGRARVYLDAPGGTQVCQPAIDRMVAHMARGTANSGGAFASSVETDALSAEAHAAVADLLGGEPGEIAFGPNMTSLTLAVSRALVSTDGGRVPLSPLLRRLPLPSSTGRRRRLVPPRRPSLSPSLSPRRAGRRREHAIPLLELDKPAHSAFEPLAGRAIVVTWPFVSIIIVVVVFCRRHGRQRVQIVVFGL